MGTSVWYLIASLLLILVNGETKDNSQSASEQMEFSTPSPGRPLTGMKELILYLTPDQAKVLEDAGAIVRPFPEFENAYLQQTLQQNIEEHTESQNQPSPEGDGQRGVEHLDEFYKVINVQQLNEDLTVAAQNVGESSENPRPKYKYVPKGRQQEYGATYVQKKNNKTKSYSTEYVRYLPNFEIENFTIEPYHAQPIPGYYYQDVASNSEPPTYLNADLLEDQKSEEVRVNKEIQQIQENQQPFEIQTQEENQKPIDTQKLEEVQPQQDIHQSQDIQRPLNLQRFEYVQKSKRPVVIQKLEEVQPQEDTYKHQDVQRPQNIQRLQFIKKPKRPVEIQKLEEVQPQQEMYRALDIQRQRNIQRLKYIQKSKRPLEIQKLEEVQRNEDIQRPVEILRRNRPVEIQKHEEVQNYAEIQRPLGIQTSYRPLEFRGEKIQRPENIQPYFEISTRTPVKEQVRNQHPIESDEPIQPSLNDKGPVTFERKPEILTVTGGSSIVAQSDDIQTQTSLEDQADVNTGSLAEEKVDVTPPTPSVSVQTTTIKDQFSSLLAPLVQHEKITESIARQTELVTGERMIQNKLQQLKDSGIVDGNKFKAEFDKLNKNLDKQNALAQKLALEAISKKQKPQIPPKENLAVKSPPLEIEGRVENSVPTPGLLSVSPHLEFRLPPPYPVPFGIVRPIPVPVLQPEIAGLEKHVPTEREQIIPAPEARNIFADFPFLVQGNDELPANYPIHQSDNLAVLRHIWDH